MKVGSLLIDMAADVARLRADMTKATSIVDGAVGKMQSAVDGLKKGIVGLAAGLTAGAFAMAIKNQIDIADAMAKTAARTGLAVQEVAGLQLAYEMSGVSSDKLESSLGRLSRNMADGSKAFSAMGVQVKNADGTLRSTRDVLGDVADKFASYADGAAKTALAQELFGRSGVEMISVLNGGREGLEEMDAQARRLGLTLDEETTAKAEQFNDTLTLLQAGGEGFTRQIAGRLAPTLASLAGELLSNVSQSESLNTISSVLSNTLKGLYSAGAIGAQIFANLGRAVGAAAAAVMAAMRGDFAGAKDIMSDVASTNASNWKAQIESLGRLWNDTGAAGVQAMAATGAASRAAAPVVGSVAAAAKKTKDEFADLLNKINAKDSGVDADYFKNLNILFEGFQRGRVGLDEYREAVEKLTQSQKFAQDIQKQLIDRAKEHTAAVDEAIKADEDARLKNESSIKTAREMLEQIQFETRALKMTNVERAKAIALRELERQGIVKGTQAYEAYAQQIQDALAGKDTVEAAIEAQKQIDDEWKKTTDSIHQSLTDALLRGFESGKDFARNLRDTVINMFRTLVLRPMIQGVMLPVSGGIAAALGGGNAMAGGGGGQSLLGAGSQVAGMAGLFGAGGLSGALAAGAGWMTGATTLGGALGAAGSLIGTGTGALSGLAMGVGALGPIALGIGAVGAALGLFRKTKRNNFGLSGTLGVEGGIHDFDLMRKSGSLFSGPKYWTVDKGVSAQDQALQDAFTALRTSAIEMGNALGLGTDKLHDFTVALGTELIHPDTGGLGLKFEGLNPDQVEAKIADALRNASNKMAQELLGSWQTVTEEVVHQSFRILHDYDGGRRVAESTAGTIERRIYVESEYARKGEEAIDTLTRLATSISSVNGIFDTLGLTLYETSLAGADMASQLADAAGGIEALQAGSLAYFQAFYSEEEQRATLMRQIHESMTRMGVDALPTTREQFRALVESLDLTTDGGRQMFAGLMGIAGAFGQVTEAAESAAQQLVDTWRGVGDSLMDVVRQIRGDVGTSGSFAFLQAEFASLTAAARAGDQDAAGRLGGVSRDLLRAAESEASSALDLQRIRAITAASVQQTAATAYDRAGDSERAEALAAEVKQLREEARAQAAAMAELQTRLLQLFRRWDVDGMPEQRAAS